MHGFLDELDQVFLTVQLGDTPLDFQIDTGFSGTLIVGDECCYTRPESGRWRAGRRKPPGAAVKPAG